MSRISISEFYEQESLCPPELEYIHNPVYQEYLSLKDKRWQFSDLLPMDKEKTILTNNKQKLKVLNLLYHLYDTAADALKAFYIDRKPELFDAHVGESACQIRAVKLAIMMQEVDMRVASQAACRYKTYISMLEKISELIKVYSIQHKYIESNIIVDNFYHKYQLNNYISDDYLYLMVIYFLSKNKVDLTIDKTQINLNEIMTHWNLSRRQGENIVRKFQIIASFHSIKYVFSFDYDIRNKTILANQLIKDKVHRWVLPTISTIEWMLKLINKYQIICELKVLIKGSHNNFVMKNRFIYEHNKIKCHNLVNNKLIPKIVITGFLDGEKANWSSHHLCRSLNLIGFGKIMLVNAASHLQYPIDIFDDLNLNPYKLNHYFLPRSLLDQKLSDLRDNQATALMFGLCKSNPSAFAVCHIHCING